MKRLYCTYFDYNYLAQGLVLWESLKKHSENDFLLYVLCLDEKSYNFLNSHELKGIVPYKLDDLEKYDRDLVKAKSSRSWVEYIFTITPCWFNFLFENINEITILNYIDADIIFFSTPELIFNEFGNNSIFIIPHNFSKDNKHLEVYGKFNVGFVGIRNDENGLKCIKWWRRKCIEWCFDKLEEDRFADQKYLDKWPKLFENVIISKNPGLNLAPYNLDNFKLTKLKGIYIVEDKPLVFYHYHRLKQLSKYLWNIDLINQQLYSKTEIITLYSLIISKIKKVRRDNHLKILTITRFNNRVLSNKGLILYLNQNISFLHSLIFKRKIDMRITISRFIKIYILIKRKIYS